MVLMRLPSSPSLLRSFFRISRRCGVSCKGWARWLLSMVTRQSGHFFFEPTDYDHVNGASNEHKEAIKVGYNLNRKIVLILIWAVAPLGLMLDPTYFGIFTEAADKTELFDQVGLIWLTVGVAGLIFRRERTSTPAFSKPSISSNSLAADSTTPLPM